jgi:hypothetical protein
MWMPQIIRSIAAAAARSSAVGCPASWLAGLSVAMFMAPAC